MDLPDTTAPSSSVENHHGNHETSFVASRLVWWMPSKPWMSRKMVLSARFGLTWWDIGDFGLRVEVKKLIYKPYQHMCELKLLGRIVCDKTPSCFEKVVPYVERSVFNKTWVRWHMSLVLKGSWLVLNLSRRCHLIWNMLQIFLL